MIVLRVIQLGFRYWVVAQAQKVITVLQFFLKYRHSINKCPLFDYFLGSFYHFTAEIIILDAPT
ncbi:MAG: hypothetical protein EAZ63_07445 [Runella slithyformis]|nr:MAG: hypothetical protein EAZ63_07445 [Runella slithyformis]